MKVIIHNFICKDNPRLLSLEGCPKEVGNYFICYASKADFSVSDILKVCDVKGRIMI